jgi:hypothetical protein
MPVLGRRSAIAALVVASAAGCAPLVADEAKGLPADAADAGGACTAGCLGGEESGPAADARPTMAAFETCTVSTTCGPSTPDAGLCNGTWTLDGTGMLTCPDPSKAPVEVTAKDLTSFDNFMRWDPVLITVRDGTKCLIDEAGLGMSVVVVLRIDGVTSAREITSCRIDWEPALLAQVGSLDAKYCRAAP